MELEFNNQYANKNQFGFKLSHKHPFLIIHLEIYDESKRNEIIEIFKNFSGHLLEENKKKGIKRIFLVDAKDIKKQLASCENNINNRKDFIIETIDLLTNEFVPLFSKIIAKDNSLENKL